MLSLLRLHLSPGLIFTKHAEIYNTYSHAGSHFILSITLYKQAE